jgi:hypothetical protein
MTDPQVPAAPDPASYPTQPVPAQMPPPVQPPVQQPVPPAATAPLLPPRPYVITPPPPTGDSAQGRRVALGVGAVLVGLLLLAAGFGIGRASAPKGPSSLVDAVRQAQQGELPCGVPGQGAGAGAFLGRLCQLAPGQGGPGLGPRGFGGNGNGGNGNNGNENNGNGNNRTGSGTGA